MGDSSTHGSVVVDGGGRNVPEASAACSFGRLRLKGTESEVPSTGRSVIVLHSGAGRSSISERRVARVGSLRFRLHIEIA